MKKIKPILLGIIIVMSIFLITACDEENRNNQSNSDHIHSYIIQSNETKHWKECSCGDKIEEENHTFGEWIIIEEATEETTGIKERECSVCHYKETETLPVLEHTHNYSIEWTIDKEATCTEAGSKSHHCLICDEKTDITEIPMKEHTFGEWIIIEEATEETTGIKERECSVCHYKETETLPVLEHTHNYSIEWTIDKEATCTEAGSKSHHCLICDEKTDITEIENLEHEYEDYICKNCQHHYFTSSLKFSLNSDGKSYSIIGIEEEEIDTLVIPAIYLNLPVTIIEKNAFYNCNSLARVIIPSSITKIEEYAFGNSNKSSFSVYYEGTIEDWCSITFDNAESNPMNVKYYSNFYLKSSVNNKWEEVHYIILPDTITKIGNYQFSGFSYVRSIDISKNVTSIGEYAFSNCSNSNSITITNSVTNIGYSAFSGCSSLKDVYFEGTIEDWCEIYFGYDVYGNWSSNPMGPASHFFLRNSENEWEEVTSIEIPNTITEIGAYQFSGFNNITAIVIPNSIMNVGLGAFYNCDNIIKATIPSVAASSVKSEKLEEVIITSGESIGHMAFMGCSKLTNITMPDSITSIGEYAFRDCISLTSIVIPNGVTRIEYQTFYGCSNLKNIIIPNNITNIDDMVFYKCDNLQYNEYDNGLYLGNEENPYLVLIKAKDTTITTCEIKNEARIIYQSAFSGCNNITSIIVPSSVICIDKNSFSECNNLQYNEYGNGLYLGNEENPYLVLIKAKDTTITSCEIPSTTKILYQSAFYLCSSISDIYYEGSIEDWCDIKFGNYNSNPMSYSSGIHRNHFYIRNSENEWEEVTSIEIPNKVTEIGYQFVGFGNVTSITIPDSVTSIGDRAFENCRSLESITIPDGITSIEDFTFDGCRSLGSIIIPEGVINIGQSVFNQCIFESITIPKSVKNIGSAAFMNMNGHIKSVYYEGTLEDWCKISFGSYYSNPMYYANHFYLRNNNNQWEEVTSIEIPNTITEIGRCQFTGFTDTSIILPDSVTSIGNSAFYGCSNLTSITIPASVKSIGEYAFENCSRLTNVYYEGTIENWCNITFSNYSSNPMYYANHFYIRNSNNEWEEVTSIEIPNTITKIGAYKFYGFNNVTSIVIPASVISIGERAFSNCYRLVEIYNLSSLNITAGSFENGYIGLYAKAIHTSLTEESQFIEKDDFLFIKSDEDKYYLVKHTGKNENLILPIDIDGNYYEINAGAFYFYDDLTYIEVPTSVTNIGVNVFLGCNNIIKAVIPSFLISAISKTCIQEVIITMGTEIEDRAFSNCSSLTSIVIPASVTNIGESAFSSCSALTNVYYEGTLEDWYNIAFENIYSNPMYYASHFYLRNSNNEWEEVTSIEIPNKVTEIGYQFFGFGNVTSITIPDSVTSIGDRAFENCRSLESITIPNSVTSIEQSAFFNCSSLESITIPFVGANFNETENNHFAYIFGAPYSGYASYVPSSLKEVIITGGTSIGNSAFSSCSSLTSIVIPDSVTSIGSYAFSYCSSLTSITIPNSVTSIGDQAFYNCRKLANVYYEGTIEDWLIGPFAKITLFAESNSNHFYLKNSNNEWEEITSIEIPNAIEEIGTGQFRGFNNVTSITISDSVISIGNSAFSSCSSLTSITIPNSVTSIGNSAFSYCSSLTSIVISDSVTSIGYAAFSACNSIIEVYYKGTLSEWNQISIDSTFNYTLTNAKRYYYSETQPTTTGNYWHYVDGVPTQW